MYRKHFALTRHPFDKDIGQEDLFESESLAELSARLRHLLDLRGIGVVTGDSGSGKTMACRRVVGGLHPGLHRVLCVSLTTGNVMDLYKTIAWEFGWAWQPWTPSRSASSSGRARPVPEAVKLIHTKAGSPFKSS